MPGKDEPKKYHYRLTRVGRDYHVYGHKEKKHWLEFVAFFVAILVAFIYWRQAQIMQDAEQRQFRAYVGFVNAQLLGSFPDSGLLRINVDMKNYGLTPATQLQISYSTEFVTSNIFDQNGMFNTEVTVPAGPYQKTASKMTLYNTVEVTAPIDAGPLSDDQMTQFDAGSGEVIWYGTIYYTDAFNRPQRTDFCVLFNSFPSAVGLQHSIMCSNHRDAT